MREDIYRETAAAYVRGTLGLDRATPEADLWHAAAQAGLKLHRFKQTMGLPRVSAVLGILRGLGPASLVDIGTGRGVFLWPLLDAFPGLSVTAVEPDAHRRSILEAVARGGVGRLSVLADDASTLPLADQAADIVTALEVIEHQVYPAPLVREAVRVASRFVVASVPSKPDDNPEHLHLFTGESLAQLLTEAGAVRVTIDYVPGHVIAIARTYR